MDTYNACLGVINMRKVPRYRVLCSNCGKEKKVTLNYKKKRTYFFCDSKCRKEFLRKNHWNKGTGDGMTTKKCEWCGNEFKLKRSTVHRRRTCSRSCSGKLRKYENPYNPNPPGTKWPSRISKTCIYYSRRILKTCIYCSRKYYVTENAKKNLFFCSKECMMEYLKKPLVPLICKNCKNIFYVYPYKAKIQQFCSQECNHQWHRGSNSPHWKGGIGSNRGSSWYKQRRTALERDNYKCQICGTKEGDGILIDVHHITPFHEYNNHEEANKLNNLICLCRKCHPYIEKNREINIMQTYNLLSQCQ